jgi:Immunoglobulin domain
MGFYINGITCLSGLGIIATSNNFDIILQPVGDIVPAYINYVFTIQCNRSSGLYYQWYKNSIKVLNATTPTLTVFSVTSSDNGDYYCVVNNETTSKRSDTATLSVLYPLVIIKQPVSIITNPLSTVSFDVDYTGSELVSIQWYFNNTIITGANSKKLTIPNVNKVNEGNYYCILSKSCGNNYSTSWFRCIN